MTSTSIGSPSRHRIDQAFRTPIALVLADIETLLLATDPNSAVGVRLRTTQRNVLRLLNLVDGLISVGKQEDGKLRPRLEMVDVSARTSSIMDRFKGVVARSGLAFVTEVEAGIVTATDADLWDRIVLNLLTNSLKFTFEGSISVKLSIRDGVIVLKVLDDGIGLSSEGLASALEDLPDAGIGLSVVKALSEALGGTFEAKSASGHGTVALVRVPLQADDGRPYLPRPAPERNVVDDFLAEAERWIDEGGQAPAAALSPLRWRSHARSKVVVLVPDAEVSSLIARSLPDDVDSIHWTNAADAEAAEADVWIVFERLVEEARPLLERKSGMKLLLMDGALPDDLQGFDEILRMPFSLAAAKLRIDGLLSRVRLERQLADAREHAQRLDSMARIVGGTSHDFSNLLVAALGNLDMAARHAEGEMAVYVGNARRAAERGARLTKHLLAFSQSGAGTPKTLDVNSVLSAVADFLGMAVGGMVGTSLTLGRGIWSVEAAPSRFELALINLALVARDSVSGTGHLRIGTQNVRDLGRDCVSISMIATGEATEAGAAARESMLPALEQAAAFASSMGGRLDADLPLSGGAKLSLLLPRATVSLDVEVPEAPDTTAAPLSILVVDDDAGVRDVAVTLLEEMGHAVVSVTGGREAVRALEHQAFDLLFVDYAMPDMTGVDVSIRARALHPGIAVVIATGYADSARLDERDEVVLRKPFGLAEISAKLAEALSARQQHSNEGVVRLFVKNEIPKDR